MKYKCVVEYDYPVDHKTPFEAILYLHGDSVQTDRIKPFYDEEWVPKEKFLKLLENANILADAVQKYEMMIEHLKEVEE